MHRLWLLALVSMVGAAPAQDTEAPICTKADTELGLYLKSHETYCSLFYQCLPDLTAVLMVCPEGLLFDDVSRVCVRPQDATCLNKQCPVDRSERSWPHICCDRYIGCKGGKFVYGTCERGKVYNSHQGCVASPSCQSHRKCGRLQRSSTPKAVCRKRVVAHEPCKFQEFDHVGNDLGVQNCAQGTSFNEEHCSCTNHHDCSSALGNRVLDPKCRATMVLDFSRKKLTSFTLKTTTGQRVENSYAIGTYGYTSENSEGVFKSLATGEKSKLYFWSFVRNMLLGPFGIKITFKVDKPKDGYSFMLIGNEMSSLRPDCHGTLDISAAFRSGQWSLSFKAVGHNTRTGHRMNAHASQTVRGTNDYITVTFTFSNVTKSMAGYVKVGRSNPVPWGPIEIRGDQIDFNNCGLAVADGLEGRLREVEFYEACGDEGILRQNLQ